MKITKAQLKQIIKEELSAVLDEEIVEEEEQLDEFDLKLGGGAGGAVERRKGEYDPYTTGELAQDVTSGLGKAASTVTGLAKRGAEFLAAPAKSGGAAGAVRRKRAELEAAKNK
tara:strand:+ start:124 stop:465 length:342 start_codon:yes stop_codon:yes gene_type:complete